MYNGKNYKTQNLRTGDIIFSYFQIGNIVLGTYRGGNVKLGTLLGTMDDSYNLDFLFQEVQKDESVLSGKGFSQPVRRESKVLNLYKSNPGKLNRRTKFVLEPTG